MHGRGTFINPEAASIQVNLMPGGVLKPDPEVRLYPFCGGTGGQESAPDQTTAEILQLEQGEEIYTVEKLFFADTVILRLSVWTVSRLPLRENSLTEAEIKNEIDL